MHFHGQAICSTRRFCPCLLGRHLLPARPARTYPENKERRRFGNAKGGAATSPSRTSIAGIRGVRKRIGGHHRSVGFRLGRLGSRHGSGGIRQAGRWKHIVTRVKATIMSPANMLTPGGQYPAET
jgi:hypothetical protein